MSASSRIIDLRNLLQERFPQPQITTQLRLATGIAPLDEAIGAENLHRYEEAVQRLLPADREAVIGRIELQYSYEELAVVLNKPTAAAARMAVTRAMKRLANEMLHA